MAERKSSYSICVVVVGVSSGAAAEESRVPSSTAANDSLGANKNKLDAANADERSWRRGKATGVAVTGGVVLRGELKFKAFTVDNSDDEFKARKTTDIRAALESITRIATLRSTCLTTLNTQYKLSSFISFVARLAN
jgi:hypothetical protein